MNLNKDVMFTVWSFLEYNDRVKWNEAMPNDLRFTKKIKTQDAHNLFIKVNFVTDLVITANRTASVIKRLKLNIKAFTYLLISKDTCLLTHTKEAFRNILIEKCKLFTKEYFKQIKVFYPKQTAKLIHNSKKLLRKLNSTKFIKEVKPALYSVH
jgi:hypothetical protein